MSNENVDFQHSQPWELLYKPRYLRSTFARCRIASNWPSTQFSIVWRYNVHSNQRELPARGIGRLAQSASGTECPGAALFGG